MTMMLENVSMSVPSFDPHHDDSGKPVEQIADMNTGVIEILRFSHKCVPLQQHTSYRKSNKKNSLGKLRRQQHMQCGIMMLCTL